MTKRNQIKKMHLSKPYSSNVEGLRFDEDYEYCLLRLDYQGEEAIYFNTKHLEKIYERINQRKIIMHPKYSVLYARTKELADAVADGFPCCVAVRDDEEKKKK